MGEINRLIEIEKRGLPLTPEQSGRLTEARSRGLIPAANINKEEQQKSSYLRGLVQSISQGTTLGFSDEITGALVATAAEIKDILTPGNDGQSFGEVYDDAAGLEREGQRQFAKENPIAATSAEIAGGVLTGGAGSGRVLATNAAKNLPKATKYAIGGAIPGGIYGAGASDDNRLSGAGIGAGAGAAGGVALPFIGKQIATFAGWASGKITNAFTTHETKALRNIKEAFDRDGVSIKQAEKNRAELGDQATLGDIGGANVSLLAEDLASKPGVALNTAKETLVNRAKGQGQRIIDAVQSKLSSKADDFSAAFDEISINMRTKAAPLYADAYATPVNNTATLQGLIENPMLAPLFKKAVKTAKSDVELPEHLKSGLDAKNPNLVVWDYVKRLVDDKASAAARGGNANNARIWGGIKNHLVNELDEQIPKYGEARKIWSSGAGDLDAMEKGTALFRNTNKDPDFALAEFNKLSDSEKELFRLGVGKTIINMVRGANDTLQGTPPASLRSKIFGSESKRSVLKAIFPDKDEFKAFSKLMKAEGKFHENTFNIIGNSRTAIRQAAAKDSGVDPALVGDAANVMSGDARGVLPMLRRLWPGGKTDPKVDAEMAQRFFTSDANSIKDTLKGISSKGNILPGWAQSVLKMKPDNMRSWLSNEKNRAKLEGYISGGSGTSTAITTKAVTG